jgi:hypothetical protein
MTAFLINITFNGVSKTIRMGTKTDSCNCRKDLDQNLKSHPRSLLQEQGITFIFSNTSAVENWEKK